MRNSLEFLAWKEYDAVIGVLKHSERAESAEVAGERLAEFAASGWSQPGATIAPRWRRPWPPDPDEGQRSPPREPQTKTEHQTRDPSRRTAPNQERAHARTQSGAAAEKKAAAHHTHTAQAKHRPAHGAAQRSLRRRGVPFCVGNAGRTAPNGQASSDPSNSGRSTTRAGRPARPFARAQSRPFKKSSAGAGGGECWRAEKTCYPRPRFLREPAWLPSRGPCKRDRAC